MVQIIFVNATRKVLGYGLFTAAAADPAYTISTVSDALLGQLGQPGDKTYNSDGTITVAPPVPDPPLPSPNYGTDSITVDQVIQGVQDIRAFLAKPTPTNAEILAYTKLLGRGELYLLRRFLP